MISLQQMHYIVVLSEELQFLRASERCFVTQPTLSMQIKKAEDTLGYLIFDRSAHPLSLTAFGEDLVPILREIMTENERIKWLCERQSNVYKEEVRLGIIPTVSSYLVPDLFAEWKAVLPNVQLIIEELRTEDLLMALEQKQLDLGILAGPHTDPKFRTVPLFQEEILIYTPDLSGSVLELSDLSDLQPWLLSKGNCLRTQMIAFCKLNDNVNTWNYQGGNVDLLVEMTSKFGGYTLVPSFYNLKKGLELKRLRSSDGFPAREVIGVFGNRSLKKSSIDTLLRSIQLRYAQETKGLSLLKWR
jgi:LysR family transcriptional regulator, hydrogen peroxide-inducible genes activator